MTAFSGGIGGDLLDRAYQVLDLEHGRLLDTADHPTGDASTWESVGEWLTLAHRMDAERVFFVGDDPVILFKRLPDTAGDAEILAAYRRAWSLARPQCLFLATQNQLRVYALNAPPQRPVDAADVMAPLDIVERSADVAEKLALYHRESVESGELFREDDYRGRNDGRADAQLLSDVHAANLALIRGGLPPAVSHALIERAILVRYLEDRSIIRPEYFEEVAGDNQAWRSALTVDDGVPQFGAHSTFASCLSDLRLAYAVFGQLESDFNGDLFRVEPDERECVEPRHLSLLRDLLTGAGLGLQQPLFLWAYDFSVVPPSLISSMYEQFHRAETDDTAGTHYTPPELVEFVLSRVLTEERLASRPRICDPACGSGVFLVEAFRRMVRHATAAARRSLTADELQELLLNRIAGVDVNAAAIRLAAFSLYLAYLHCLDAGDIRRAGALPRLIHRPDDTVAPGVLVTGNAFSPDAEQRGDEPGCLPWNSGSFDVVVGNPPWGEPKGADRRMGDAWAKRRGMPVGDRSPSQQFLWRALSLLRPDGAAALLVASAALLNVRSTSQRFRSEWLQRVQLQEVVDFTSARHLFFEDSAAPFTLLVFGPGHQGEVHGDPALFSFCTVRPSRSLEATRALSHARIERRWVDQGVLAARDYLWKTYAWGNHHDAAFMARLDLERRLAEVAPDDPSPGWGYQPGGKPVSDRLGSLPSLAAFDSWGPFVESRRFESPPTGVEWQPKEFLFDGPRIIIAQGIRSGFGPAARLESEPFSFRNTIYCVPVRTLAPWQAKTVLGTLLSSLGRYRLFMKSGKWGLWSDKLLAHDILDLPTRFADEDADITRRITDAVDAIALVEDTRVRAAPGVDLGATGIPEIDRLLVELDEAIFDLFNATDWERDLVRDFTASTLPLVGRKARWLDQPGIEFGPRLRGTAADLASAGSIGHIDRYLSTFLGCWNRELAPSGEFSWSLSFSGRTGMAAAIFETKERDAPMTDTSGEEDGRWLSALDRLGLAIGGDVTSSIRSTGTLRSVSDRSIVVAKMNEARLWTASAARADAEATILQAINLQTTS